MKMVKTDFEIYGFYLLLNVLIAYIRECSKQRAYTKWLI